MSDVLANEPLMERSSRIVHCTEKCYVTSVLAGIGCLRSEITRIVPSTSFVFCGCFETASLQFACYGFRVANLLHLGSCRIFLLPS
jgi:hypothetical protein